MGAAIAQAIPIGLAMALSPFPVIGIVLILAAPSGRARAVAFLAGALGGVGVVSAAILALESGAGPTEGGDPATWVSVLKLLLALALVVLAATKWRKRPRAGEAPDLPAWMGALQTLSAWRAVVMGVLLTGLNPKNLVLMAAASTAIAGSTDDPTARVAALAFFVVAACLGVIVPVAATLVLGPRAARPLDAVREWMLRHNTTITVAIVVLIAAKLAIDAIAALGS